MDRTTRLVPPLLVGVGAGILSGLFGVGGGILVVPALTMVLKLDQRMASGTSLGAVFPISVASLATYWSQDNVDWAMALWLAIGAVAGAVYGTKLIHRLPRRTIGYLFTAMLILTAIRLYVPTEADGRGAIEVGSAIALVIIGFLTGVLAGLLGIGGGVIMVPIMIVLFGEIPVIAKGTAVAVTSPTALSGTLRNLRARNIDVKVAIVVGLAGIPTAIFGSLVADTMSKDLSNALFATLVLAVASKMLWDLRRNSAA
ncbi:MAG: sulfite exporter TauE/SafE family protein [Ilumatobacteraceae bacterium]